MRRVWTKFSILILFSLGLASASLAHNVYQTFTTLSYNKNTRNVELVLLVHAEELEALLSVRLGKRMSFMHDEEYAALLDAAGEELLKSYQISADGIPLEIIYVGLEVENRTVHAYLKAAFPTAPKSYTVMNSLFLDLLDKQENHIQATGLNGPVAKIIRRGDDPVVLNLSDTAQQ